jgi:hypothetical protein
MKNLQVTATFVMNPNAVAGNILVTLKEDLGTETIPCFIIFVFAIEK